MYECGLNDRQELETIQNLILDRIRYLREKEADLTTDGILLDYYSKNDEILNCSEINSIYISTLNNTHADIVIRVAQAKKNILCEKPIATNYDDTIKIFEKLDKSEVFFFELFFYEIYKYYNNIKNEHIY